MKRLINKKTTTIKISTKEDENQAILRHDALIAILVSANPLRGEYLLGSEDYKYIAKTREEVNGHICKLQKYLEKLKK